MTQPQALTTQQIQNYQNQIQNAGTLAQQKAAAIAVYQDLYSKGYNYAGWALGVAKGNTITGTAALDYLSGTALMGLGNTEMCRNLTPAQVDKIRVDMAWNTMEQMKLAAKDTGGILTQDLGFKPVEAAHEVGGKPHEHQTQSSLVLQCHRSTGKFGWTGRLQRNTPRPPRHSLWSSAGCRPSRRGGGV